VFDTALLVDARSRIAEGECVIGPRVPQGNEMSGLAGVVGYGGLLNRNRHGRCAGA
jgi:hypothetical protein